MRMNKLVAIALIGVAAAASGCASSQKAGVYQTGQVQQKLKVVLATVIDVREVAIEATPTGAGASVGMAAGAVAGATTGHGTGNIASTVAGAAIGGVAGTVTEKLLSSTKGVEILYQPDGTTETLALVQEKDEQNVIGKGDHVRIIEGQFSVRAVKLAAQ